MATEWTDIKPEPPIHMTNTRDWERDAKGIEWNPRARNFRKCILRIQGVPCCQTMTDIFLREAFNLQRRH